MRFLCSDFRLTIPAIKQQQSLPEKRLRQRWNTLLEVMLICRGYLSLAQVLRFGNFCIIEWVGQQLTLTVRKLRSRSVVENAWIKMEPLKADVRKMAHHGIN